MGSSDSGFSAWDDFWKSRAGKNCDSWAKTRITGILSNYVKPGMNVLDAGCGAGFFSSYFISKSCNVYSMDYSEKALSITRDITNNKSRMYLKGNILDAMVFRGIDVEFDVVFTDGLLEHYSDKEQDKIISNMKLAKRQSGLIINFVPNRFSLWSMVRPFVMNIKESPFVLDKFIGLHKRNNLRVISNGGINVLPFKVSPERLLGRHFGMLFYCIAM